MHRSLVHGVAALALLVASPVAAQNNALPLPPAAQAAMPELPQLQAPAPPAERLRAVYGHDIVIRGTAEFVEHVTGVLDELGELPTGRAILEALGQDPHSTVIVEFNRANATVRPLFADEAYEARRGLFGDRAGTAALLSWNPDFELAGFTRPVIMGHELIHALHINRGQIVPRRRILGPNRGTALEELITIGTDGYEDRELTENRLRTEWNELYPDLQIPPVRYGHGGQDLQEAQPDAAQHPGPEQTLVDDSAPAPAASSGGLRGAIEGVGAR